MRHAKAERSSPTGEDFDRGLDARGRRDAALMGKALAQSGLRPDRALVSDAARTRQTWDETSAAFPPVQTLFRRDLYLADPDEILSAVEAQDDADTLMVVGHNPGVHALALRLLQFSSAAPAVMARFQGGYPTATAAVFNIDEAGRAHYDGLFLASQFGGGGPE